MQSYIYLLVIAGIILQALFISVEHNGKLVLADILKGSAAFMFVLIGYNAYLVTNNPFNKQLLLGLFFGMVGDILLNLRYIFPEKGQKIFIAGIVAFLIGHIMYLVALIPQAHYDWLKYCVIIGIIVAALLLLYIFKTMEVKTVFKIFGVFYLGAVFVMCSIAIGIAIFVPTRRSIIYAIGAVLFTVSDVILIFNTFSGTTRFSLRICNLFMYYIGQILIALSMFY